jgi:hypothetical protein
MGPIYGRCDGVGSAGCTCWTYLFQVQVMLEHFQFVASALSRAGMTVL